MYDYCVFCGKQIRIGSHACFACWIRIEYLLLMGVVAQRIFGSLMR